MAACLEHEWNTQHFADRYEQQDKRLWQRLLYWRWENETAYTIPFLYQMFFVFWEQIIPKLGKTGMRLSNLNFSCFMLPLEVIFPQIEIAAAREAVLSLQYRSRSSVVSVVTGLWVKVYFDFRNILPKSGTSPPPQTTCILTINVYIVGTATCFDAFASG